MSTGQDEGAWANIIKPKKTRVKTTLVRSEAYKVGKDTSEET